ncbi:hypothetical protein BD626DRAFT_573853 [Schizophyllum amplum]|uniref:Berberine/berberine-like domain-containing protein n=1 Tax=Schizophyllum amplum TaxID=97359 RepID=A0A550C0A6_9AGAR|nr:hypothetical protein BD626DRAFT_573853 [Auriculariopsis ampla]
MDGLFHKGVVPASAGGGFGFQSRIWGLLLDRVVSEAVVVYNGTAVTVSADENPDLFWEMRVAGASLGVLTSFVFTAEPSPPQDLTFTYNWDFTASEASRALAAFQDFVQIDIPATLGGELVINKSPTSGNLAVQCFCIYFDDVATSNQTVAPFMDLFREPDSASVTEGDWITVCAEWATDALDTTTLDLPLYNTSYVKSILVPEEEVLSTSAMNAFIEYLATAGHDPDPGWRTVFLSTSLRIGLTGRQEVYYGKHYEKLTELKSTYESGDVFHVPHSVKLKA